MKDYDFVFIEETHCNGNVLPIIDGFNIIADPSFPTLSSHGGIALYIKTHLFEYVSSIRFTKISLSFKLTCFPKYCFMAVYMYPEDSNNHDTADFGILSEEIDHWLEQGIIPFIGGDFNSRLGDLNQISAQSLKWIYNANIDTKTNSHGTSLADVCQLHKILPLNHCRYRNKKWDGKFTYFKAGKQSQIDFCLTTQHGRQLVKDFKIPENDWHFSDHLPVDVSLSLIKMIDAHMLLLRTKELDNEHRSNTRINQFRYDVDVNSASLQLEDAIPTLMDSIALQPIDSTLRQLQNLLHPVLRNNRITKKYENVRQISPDFNQCNIFYSRLQEARCGNVDDAELNKALDEYQAARKKLNKDICNQHEKHYKSILNKNDTQKLWKEINWSGKYKKQEVGIHVDTMADYFEKLYEPLDLNESKEFDELHTSINIPITDDPISAAEIESAAKKTKKGGYDYSLSVLQIFTGILLPFITLFLNSCFFVAYPNELALSILCAIPKKGNLRLLTNYRGIQLQPLLALIYDRIIHNRLLLWAKFCVEQSAFQKGRCTTDQIFLLRTIIALIRHSKKSLFIGFFDLSKAFDKVSRTLLLKSLIKVGIGSVMFYAIKSIYSVTKCVLKAGDKLSDVFRTYTGIKQGAPSSVILFLIFMDEFIVLLREKCIAENVLGALHILLHADDTVVISTTRELFISKCNILLAEFNEKKMSINVKKSGFMVINSTNHEDRLDIKLESCWLYYVKEYVYLGVIFSDSGVTHTDLAIHAREKNKAVIIKLANFIRNNSFAPITVKSMVLNACTRAAIIYGHEAWGSSPLNKIESLFRKAIRIAFSLHSNTPNEIIYLETGIHELKAEIYRSQFKFWEKIKEFMIKEPDSTITEIYNSAINSNVHFLRHYIKLHTMFSSSDECFSHYRNEFIDSTKTSIRLKANNENNIVHKDYILLNTELKTPNFYSTYSVIEHERLILSKYRTGSHHLKLLAGSRNNTPRDRRLCKCKEIQSLHHIVFECVYTNCIRTEAFRGTIKSLADFFDRDEREVAGHLIVIEAKLKLR